MACATLVAVAFVGFDIRDAGAEGAPKFVLAWGKKGDQPGEFYSPISIAINRKDEVDVTDLNNDRVQAFTPEGKFLFGIGDSGDEPGQFHKPHGMAVDAKGFLYVADAGNQRIQKFQIPDP